MNLKQNFFLKTTVFVKLKSIANEQSLIRTRAFKFSNTWSHLEWIRVYSLGIIAQIKLNN